MTKANKGGRPRTNPPPLPFDRMVGSRVRVRRAILKIPPGVFAAKIGRSVSQVYRLESGDVAIRGELLPKIAGVLGCSVSDLVDGIKAK